MEAKARHVGSKPQAPCIETSSRCTSYQLICRCRIVGVPFDVCGNTMKREASDRAASQWNAIQTAGDGSDGVCYGVTNTIVLPEDATSMTRVLMANTVQVHNHHPMACICGGMGL